MRSQQKELKKLNATVVIITFGPAYLAKNWIEETQAPFLVLIDEERAAYRAYGLERSLVRSWGIKTIWRYAQLLLSGRRWRGIQGDSGQLGGDFIVDTQGMLRLVYPSQNPTDRPPISELLQIFEQLQ